MNRNCRKDWGFVLLVCMLIQRLELVGSALTEQRERAENLPLWYSVNNFILLEVFSQWPVQRGRSLVWFSVKIRCYVTTLCVWLHNCFCSSPVAFLIQPTRCDERPDKLHENQWLHKGEKLFLCLHHMKACSMDFLTEILEALYKGDIGMF